MTPRQSLSIYVDHLNTPRLVADAAGTTVWKWDQQEPFGNNVADENPSGLGAFELSLRLPGQYFDKETNLHYNMERDYWPEGGLYVESDPIGLQGGLNTYAYAYSSPLDRTDPYGLFVAPAAVVTVATVRAAAAIIATAAASSGSTPQGTSANGSKECKTCEKDYAAYVKCSVLYDYPYWSLYAALQSMGGGRAHSPTPATEGPCTEEKGKVPGKHYNVRGKGQGRGSIRLGSIVMCPCCEDRPGGAVLREKYQYIP